MVFTIEFGNFVENHSSCRHVDANSKSLGSKDNLYQTSRKARFHDLLESRNDTRMVRSDARLKLFNELCELKRSKIIITETC